MLSLVGSDVAHAAPERVSVVVGAQPGGKPAAERLVRRLGGDVGQRLPIVDGFTARMPAGSIARLRRAGSVRSAVRDVALTLSSVLQARPGLTPDQVKALLRAGAAGMPADVSAAGAGRVDLGRTLELPVPGSAAQQFAPAVLDRRILWADLQAEASGEAPAVGTGENGWAGRRWSGRRWSGRSWSGRRWSGSDWSGGHGS